MCVQNHRSLGWSRDHLGIAAEHGRSLHGAIHEDTWVPNENHGELLI